MSWLVVAALAGGCTGPTSPVMPQPEADEWPMTALEAAAIAQGLADGPLVYVGGTIDEHGKSLEWHVGVGAGSVVDVHLRGPGQRGPGPTGGTMTYTETYTRVQAWDVHGARPLYRHQLVDSDGLGLGAGEVWLDGRTAPRWSHVAEDVHWLDARTLERIDVPRGLTFEEALIIAQDHGWDGPLWSVGASERLGLLYPTGNHFSGRYLQPPDANTGDGRAPAWAFVVGNGPYWQVLVTPDDVTAHGMVLQERPYEVEPLPTSVDSDALFATVSADFDIASPVAMSYGQSLQGFRWWLGWAAAGHAFQSVWLAPNGTIVDSAYSVA